MLCRQIPGISSTDQETGGSSKAVIDSPDMRKAYVHNQILRIREEESHIGQDNIPESKGGGGGAKDNNLKPCGDGGSVSAILADDDSATMRLVLFSRLPCSRLSGKTPPPSSVTAAL